MVGRRVWVSLLAAALPALAPSSVLSAQESASLAGVLVSDASGQLLRDGIVSLVGSSIRTTTDARGQFVIEGLPVGAIRVRFEAPGYVSVVEDVDISVGAYYRVPLSPVDAVLDAILVRAGRRQAPDHDGAQTVTVDEEVDGWRSILDLLDDQVPGVVVHRGGALGGGAYVAIRGAGTLQGDNAPDIYLDGSRVSGENTGSWTLHTLDLISAEDVSSVRVYKGAAGAAGFALGGANGVIVIETNRGKPAPSR